MKQPAKVAVAAGGSKRMFAFTTSRRFIMSHFKKPFFAMAALLMLATCSFAQTSVEFIPSAGYTFSDRVSFYNAYGKIDGALNLGGSFLFNVNRRFGLELMYDHIGTNSGLYNYGYQGGSQIAGGNLALDYIMFGPVQSFNIPGSPVRPFIGAMLGASVFSPGVNGFGTDVKFAWGAQLGTNIYITPRFALRLQAKLLAPSDGSQEGFYVGKDNTGTPISAYSDVYQFSLNAGLVIGLGRVLPPLQPRRNMYRRPGYRRRYPPYPY